MPPRAPRGPGGPFWDILGTKKNRKFWPVGQRQKNIENLSTHRIFPISGVKKWSNKVEIEGLGPIWRDPRRNSVQKAVPGVPYGGMATHLVTKRCDFGSLGVPGPASTPRLGGRAAAAGGRHACVRESLSLLLSPHSLYISHTQNRYPALRGDQCKLHRRCFPTAQQPLRANRAK